MLAIFAPLVSWIFRGVVVKFVVLAGIFGAVSFLIPFAVSYLAPHIGVGGLNGSFSGLDSGIWWILDMFNLTYGVPLLISAYVARFLIRRLPVIG